MTVDRLLPRLQAQVDDGLELGHTIAGPGARCYAFLIDWHLRVLLALAWYLGGTLIIASIDRAPWHEALFARSTAYFYGVLFPAFLIYALYHPVLEMLMHGRTPGKRWAGVRVVDRHGRPPTLLQHLIRNVFRLIDQLPAVYLIGLISTLLTRQHVRLGDLAAGTVLVVDAPVSIAALGDAVPASGALDYAQRELVLELRRRWSELEAPERTRLARVLLGKLGVNAVGNLDEADLKRLLEERLDG
jgi:uncharacterized RDD family membrane protein YckC